MKNVVFGIMAMCAAWSGVVNSAVLNFDDIVLNDSYTTISSVGAVNYGGFNWDARWFIGDTSNTNYSEAAKSGSQFLSNGNNVNDLLVSGGSLFDFDGAWFTTPSHTSPAKWINISAYDESDNLIGSTGDVAINTITTWVGAYFNDVSYLNISRDNGWFTMDDFTYSAAAVEAPESSSWMLLSLVLAGLGLSRKRSMP